MPETTDTDKQHRYDVLDVGDRVPMHNSYATVTDREVVDEVEPADDIPEWAMPQDHWLGYSLDGVGFVLYSLEPEWEDGEPFRVPAERLFREVKESFNQHGLPRISATPGGAGRPASIDVQTPATGSNLLDAEGARDLAEFLRDNAGFEPLYALLARTDSAEDMNALADSFDRAADVIDYAEKAGVFDHGEKTDD